MKNELSIGSISEGTLKTEDIGASLIWNLDQINLDPNDLDTYRKLKRVFSTAIEQQLEYYPVLYCDSHIEHVYDEIKAIADNYTPDYCYLGMNIGCGLTVGRIGAFKRVSGNDGASFGVWPEPQLFEDLTQGGYDGYVYRSTVYTNSVEEHVPAEYSHYLAVNDHGNCTLWARNGDTWRECWAIV